MVLFFAGEIMYNFASPQARRTPETRKIPV
jgi:hypothetical protein